MFAGVVAPRISLINEISTMPLTRGYEIKIDGKSLGEFLTVAQCHEAIKNHLQSTEHAFNEITFELINHVKGEFTRVRILRDAKTDLAGNDSFFDHWLQASGLKVS